MKNLVLLLSLLLLVSCDDTLTTLKSGVWKITNRELTEPSVAATKQFEMNEEDLVTVRTRFSEMHISE